MAQDITSFVSQKRYEGVKDDELRAQLIASGYPDADIETALATPVGTPMPPVAVASTQSGEPVPSAHMPVNKRSFYVLGGFVLLLLITGTGFYLYYTSPQQVLKRMVANLQKIKTFSYTFDVGMSGNVAIPSSPLTHSSSVAKPSPLKVGVSVSGSSSYWDGENLNGFLGFSGNYKEGSNQFSLGKWELRGVGKTLYIGMQDAPTVGFDTSVLNSYKNNWLQVDLTDYLKKLPDAAKSGDKAKQEKQIAQIRQVLQKRKIITKYDSLPSDTINGMSMHHYRLTVDQVALFQSADEINKVLNPDLASKSTFKKDDNVETTIHPIDVWVGKKDELLYKVSGVIDGKDKNHPENGTSTVTLSFGLADHNKPINTEKPTEKIWSTQEIMQDLQMKLSSSSAAYSPSPYSSGSNPTRVLGARTKVSKSVDTTSIYLLMGLLSSVK